MFGNKTKIEKGKFIDDGGKLGSTFKTVPALIDAFYGAMGKEFAGVLPMGKAANATVWGTDGTTNPIFGARMTVAMYNTQNAFTAIGSKPYDHEGVRIVSKLAIKSGVGATTSRDGEIPESEKPDIKAIRQPYVDLPYQWDYGLGLMALEGMDDVIAFENFADIQAATYGNALDADLLRPTDTVMPDVDDQETTIVPLSKIIASSDEIGNVYSSATVTQAMVSPFGGAEGDVFKFRSATTGTPTFNSKVVQTDGALALEDLKALYYGCMPYWNNQSSPNNKVWILSGNALQMVDALREKNNMVITGSSEAYVKWDFNGVSTIPGMDAGGIAMRAMYGIPAIMDNNTIAGPDGTFNDADMGELFLADTDHVFYSMLTPITLRSSDAVEVTRKLRRVNVIHSRGNTRFTRATGHGKIVPTEGEEDDE